MAIPSGAGTEVLKRCNLVAVTTGTVWSVNWTGGAVTSAAATNAVPANHIITVISIIITNSITPAKTIDMYIESLGTNNCKLLNTYPMLGNETFTWNERFFIHPTDRLIFSGNTGSNFDVWVSYIDQDWS